MKFSLLVATGQINSEKGKILGSGSVSGLIHLAELMQKAGIKGDLIDLPNQARDPAMASPFSIESGFALNPLELDWFSIPEMRPENPIFLNLKVLNKNFNQHFHQQRSLSYQLKSTLSPWVLDGCFQVFQSSTEGPRKEAYQQFKQRAQPWLDPYIWYKAAKKKGLGPKILQQLKQSVVREAFVLREKSEIQLQSYIQFLCYEQRLALLASLREKGIRLFVNLPFGVDRFSPDVIFHPEAFDSSTQVGCSPEPENGYPEQAWGMPSYRERTAGLEQYLQRRFQWLKQICDGLFVDHLVGWSGQYILPKEAQPEDGVTKGRFLTQDPGERAKNIDWYLDLVLGQGLSVLAEVAGDSGRLAATQAGVLRKIAAGGDLKLMSLPRWQRQADRLVPLAQVQPQTLLMSETHDTSTLLQYLLNQKGGHPDFESEDNLLEFCQTILALPLHPGQLPLKLEQLNDDLCFELLDRLVNGSKADQFAMTLPSLLSWLDPKYRNASLTNNINVAPGTGGEVGNEQGNWSFYSPPIELLQEPKFQKILQKIGNRKLQAFDPVHQLVRDEQISILYTQVGQRRVIFQEAGKFKLLEGKMSEKPGLFELSLANLCGEVVEGMLNQLGWLPHLGKPGTHVFCDLNQGQVCYQQNNKQLKHEGLFYRLQPTQTHHFLVWFEPES